MYFIHSKVPLFPKNLFSIQKVYTIVKNAKHHSDKRKEFGIKVPTTDLACTGFFQLKLPYQSTTPHSYSSNETCLRNKGPPGLAVTLGPASGEPYTGHFYTHI